MASLDDYFKKRTEGMQNPTQTATLTDTKPADPVSTYIDRISQTLAGKDPVVQNARQDASTKNAVGDYLANRQAKQESVNAGYNPGTLQSQRTADRYQAGANESALTRDAGVNDLARQRTDTAMGAANQLRTEGVQQTETLRREGLAEIETLIDSVKDPVTQAYLRRIQAAGGDVRGALAGNIGKTGAEQPGTGTLPPTGGNDTTVTPGTTNTTSPVDPNTGLPISKTPAQLAQESAVDWVKTINPNLDPSSPEFAQLVQARVGGADEAQLRTITEANKAAKIKDVQTKASSNFASLTPEETALLLANTKSLNPMEIPVGRGGFEAFKAVKGNELVQIGGKLYKPLRTLEWRQGQNRDFSVFEGQDGTTLYVDRSGKTTTQPPPDKSPSKRSRTAWLESFK